MIVCQRATRSSPFSILRYDNSGRQTREGNALKFSLLSATSIFALFAATVLPGRSAGFAAEISIDLVEPSDWVGIASGAVPTAPPGVAAGTKPDEDFASSADGAAQFDAVGKARATGRAMIAPLIGTLGKGSLPHEKPGATVFAAAGSQIGFVDGGDTAAGLSDSVDTDALTSSNSRTATITVAGGTRSSRVGSGSVPYVAFANSDQATPATAGLPERVQPDIGYRDPPLIAPAGKSNLMAASFSDAGTAAVRIGGSARQSNVRGCVVTFDHRLIGEVQTIIGSRADITGDGTKVFLSASVSANPRADAMRYLASVVDPTTANSITQTVGGLQVQVGLSLSLGPNRGDITTIFESLKGRIPANGGPLNNLLALP